MPGSRSRPLAVLALALVLLGCAVAASVCVGARSVAPVEVWRALVAFADTDDHITVRDIRIPRTVLGVCVGAALAVSGALIQSLTSNPLAEPGLLGITAGAGFAVNLGVLSGVAGSQSSVLTLAVVGCACAALVVYAVGQASPLRLVLAGVALTFVLLGVSLGMRLLNPDVFDRHRFWSVGALAGTEQTPLTVPVLMTVLALAGALVVTGPLSAVALGEDVAHSLGVDVNRTRVAVFVLVTLLAGAATAVTGPIAFVGLIVPHLARRLAAGSVPWLIALSMVLGPVLLLTADIGSRLLLPTGEVPVAVVTAFLGGPVLIWVVRRHGAASL